MRCEPGLDCAHIGDHLRLPTGPERNAKIKQMIVRITMRTVSYCRRSIQRELPIMNAIETHLNACLA